MMWLLSFLQSLFSSPEEVEVWRGVVQFGGVVGSMTLRLSQDRFNRRRLSGHYQLEGEAAEQGTALAFVQGESVLGSLSGAKGELVFEGKAAVKSVSLNLAGNDGRAGSAVLLREQRVREQRV